KAPVTAVQALVTVVAQNKVLVAWDNHFTLAHVILQLIAPAPVNFARIRLLRREIIALAIRHPLAVNGVALMQRNAVHIYAFVAQTNMVPGQPDHPLHQKLGRIHGKVKNNDVSTLNFAIRQQLPRARVTGKVQLVHEQKVADQESVFHGAGGNLECLNNKGDDKNAEDHHRKKALDAKEAALVSLYPFTRNTGASQRDRRPWLCPYRRRLHGLRGLLHLVSTLSDARLLPSDLFFRVHAFSGCARRCSKACLAASCSAFFLVAPSARATYSGLLWPCT